MRAQRPPAPGVALAFVGVGLIFVVVALVLLLGARGTNPLLAWSGLGAGVAALVVGAARWSSARHPRG